MKLTLTWCLAAITICFALLLTACDKTASQIRAAEGASNRAILNNDGKAAIQYLSKGSITRLSTMLSLARTATKSQVKALPISDKFDVLAIRASIPAERLRKLNGYECYIEAVENDWIWSTVGLKRVRYSFDADRTQAKVTYQLPFSKETFDLNWVFEDGTWKEDEVASQPEINRWLRAAAKDAGLSEDDFILATLKDWDLDVTDTIWNPKY